MALLNQYLMFDGNAREAIETYRDIFGGTLDVNTFGEYGAGEDGPPADGIMHAQLTTDLGFTIMASDRPPSMDADANGWQSLSGNEGDTLRGYFDRLSEGGQVTLPLEKQMWGDTYGQVTDKFGVNWMVNIADPTEATQ